jgi:membrane-associated phospholipid phosphatase
MGLGLLVFASTLAKADKLSVNWAPEIVGTLAGTGVYFWLDTKEPRRVNTEAEPQFIDAWAPLNYHPGLEPLSDFLGHPLKHYGINGPILSLAASSFVVGKGDVQQGLSSALVLTETVVTTGLVTEGIKLLIARPRPYTNAEYLRLYPEAEADTKKGRESLDAYQSFPSGHTSSATAVYTATAMILSRHESTQFNPWVMYGVAGGLSIATAATRVKMSMHHPSDVLTGLLIGAGIGTAIPALHFSSETEIAMNGTFISLSRTW